MSEWEKKKLSSSPGRQQLFRLAPSRTGQDLGQGSLDKMPRGHETKVTEDRKNEVTLPGA